MRGQPWQNCEDPLQKMWPQFKSVPALNTPRIGCERKLKSQALIMPIGYATISKDAPKHEQEYGLQELKKNVIPRRTKENGNPGVGQSGG
jgi:hypothetical protein